MTSLFETRSNIYLYEAKPNEATKRLPNRKLITSQEIEITALPTILKNLHFGIAIDYSDSVVAQPPANLDNSLFNTQSVLNALDKEDASSDTSVDNVEQTISPQDLLDLGSVMQRIIFSVSKDGITYEFQDQTYNAAEKRQTYQTLATAIMSNDEFVAKSEQVQFMINEIAAYVQKYIQNQIKLPEYRDYRSNPLYDVIAYMYALAIKAGIHKSFPRKLIVILALRKDTTMENVAFMLAKGVELSSNLLDEYVGDKKQEALNSRLRKVTKLVEKDGETIKEESEETVFNLVLYSVLGTKFNHPVRVAMRNPPVSAHNITVDLETITI